MKSFKAFVFLYFSGLGGFGILGVLYLLEIGYSFTEISVLSSIFVIAIFVLELPTGIVADIKGARYSILLSAVLRFITAIGYVYAAGSFTILIVATLVGAVSESFISGALQSEAISTGKRNQINEHQAIKFLTRYRLIGSIFGGSICYAVYQYNAASTWIVSGMLFILAYLVYVLSSRRHANLVQHIKVKVPPIAEYKQVFYNLFNRAFFWAAVFKNIAAIAPMILWQYIFNLLDFGILIGFIFYQIFALIATTISNKKKFNNIYLFIVNAILILLLGFFPQLGYIALLIFSLHVMLQVIQNIIVESNFQKKISNKHRSSCGSLVSASDSLISVPQYLAIGLLFDSEYYLYGLLISSFTTLLSGIFYTRSIVKR
ncbi:hypothetical protein [uncultured Gammaproteobacteria bacterium]|nr:hypothetical protein [uncultured Gammaproteobacteria bacterium]